MKSILVADPFYLTREGLIAIVDSMPGYQLMHALDQPTDLNHAIVDAKPDLVIGNNLPQGHFQFDEILKESIFLLKGALLYVSNGTSNHTLQALIKYGARGIIAQESTKDDLTQAISVVASGNSYFGSDIYQQALTTDSSTSPKDKLSHREYEVLQYITKGLTTSEISERLNISTHTISTHRKNILKKLGLISPAQLIAYAYENNLV